MEWIKCTDRLPGKYDRYLVWIEKCGSLGSSSYFWCDFWWERIDGESGGHWVNLHEDEMVTHWALPEPPTAENEDN